MRIKEYPYSVKRKITKTLKKATTWINRNMKKSLKSYEEFGYPEFCGMPKSISSRLNTDEADWIEGEFNKEKYKNSQLAALRFALIREVQESSKTK